MCIRDSVETDASGRSPLNGEFQPTIGLHAHIGEGVHLRVVPSLCRILEREHAPGLQVRASGTHRIDNALQRARTKSQVDALVDLPATPDPIDIATQIAGGNLPVRADLLLDGRVP